MREYPVFNEGPHTYTLGGVELPSVTRIIKNVIPVCYHGATEWHMDRGKAVHQCCAMVCKGTRFSNDRRIDGQVQSCRAWLEMRRPEVVSVERMVWRAAPIPYAGTLDLLCRINGDLWIVDWKGSASKWDKWQLGGYADALSDEGINPRFGLIVELNENGKPKESGVIDLRRARNEWKSILNVRQMLHREGLINE